MGIRSLLFAFVTLFAPLTASAAITLVQTSDPGFYNNSLGNLLDNTNGGNTPTGYFPTSDDSTVTFPIEPDLSSVGSILGNWLGNPLNLNSNWSGPISIPPNWPVSTEVAVIYQFNTLGATNVVAQFGVDNGIFIWLNGVYQTGSRAGGGPSLGEVTFNIGNLAPGTHFLQLLLEDHGGSNGYATLITADTFIEGPPPGPGPSVPLPSSLALLGIGLAALGIRRKRKT